MPATWDAAGTTWDQPGSLWDMASASTSAPAPFGGVQYARLLREHADRRARPVLDDDELLGIGLI